MLRYLLKYNRHLLCPAEGVVIFAWLALAGLVLGSFISLFLFTLPDNGRAALAVEGGLVLPAAALLLGFAGIFERSPAPRAWMWLVCAAGLLAAGLLLLAASGAWGLLCLPAAAAPLAGGILALRKVLPALRQSIRLERETRLAEMVQKNPELDLAEAGRSVELTAGQAAELLAGLTLPGFLDRARGRFLSAAALRERQTRLSGRLAEMKNGEKLSLAALTRALDAPPALLEEWLAQACRRDGFSGWVNGSKDELVRAEWDAAAGCPACGAALPAGQAVNRDKEALSCPACGSRLYALVEHETLLTD